MNSADIELVMSTFYVDRETATKMMAAGVNVDFIRSDGRSVIEAELHPMENLSTLDSVINGLAKNTK